MNHKKDHNNTQFEQLNADKIFMSEMIDLNNKQSFQSLGQYWQMTLKHSDPGQYKKQHYHQIYEQQQKNSQKQKQSQNKIISTAMQQLYAQHVKQILKKNQQQLLNYNYQNPQFKQYSLLSIDQLTQKEYQNVQKQKNQFHNQQTSQQICNFQKTKIINQKKQLPLNKNHQQSYKQIDQKQKIIQKNNLKQQLKQSRNNHQSNEPKQYNCNAKDEQIEEQQQQEIIKQQNFYESPDLYSVQIRSTIKKQIQIKQKPMKNNEKVCKCIIM